MTDRKVPLGISIITILMYIGAILDIAAGLFLILDKTALAEAAAISESTLLYSGIASLAFGIIIGLLAMGLRGGSNGVRLFIAVIMVLRAVFGVWALIAVQGARFSGFATAVIALVVLYFLYVNEDSKEFFA